MSVLSILADVSAAGLHLYVDGSGALRARGNRATYTPELRALVGEHRTAIVATLAAPDLPPFDASTTTPAIHWRAVAATNPDAGLVGLFGSALAGALVLNADEWEAADHDDRHAAAVDYAEAWERALAGRLVAPVVTPPAVSAMADTPPVENERQARALAAAPAVPAPTWDEPTAGLVSWLATVTSADLPPVVEIRPGVVVSDPARFVVALRADVAAGPGTIRAGRGLLARDLADLWMVVEAGDAWPRVAAPARDAADVAAPEAEAGRPSSAAAKYAPDGTSATPAEHLAELGGHAGAVERFGYAPALALWDTARLAERDRGTEREARWTSQYWRAWERAQMGGCS